MSHLFPPPTRRAWWKFKSLGALRTDRGHYRSAIANYDRARAAQGLPPVKHPGWVRRHMILTFLIAPVALFVLVFAVALVAVIVNPPSTVAEPATKSTIALPAGPSQAPSDVPTPRATAASALAAKGAAATQMARREAEAAAKKAEQERVAAEKKSKAAEAKRVAAAKAAAKRVAAAAAKKKAAAAKKAAAKKAAARRAAAEQAEQDRFESRNIFSNCTDLRGTYPHGVGLPGTRDQVRGKTRPVTTFLRSAKIYQLNSESDRDGDGIACEQR